LDEEDEQEEEEWIEHFYQRNPETNKSELFHKTNKTSRQELSRRIAYELGEFELHQAHHYFWKYQSNLLLKDLLPNHIVVRWDFIGKRKKNKQQLKKNRKLCPP
jgi:hypothetical protein